MTGRIYFSLNVCDVLEDWRNEAVKATFLRHTQLLFESGYAQGWGDLVCRAKSFHNISFLRYELYMGLVAQKVKLYFWATEFIFTPRA